MVYFFLLLLYSVLYYNYSNNSYYGKVKRCVKKRDKRDETNERQHERGGVYLVYQKRYTFNVFSVELNSADECYIRERFHFCSFTVLSSSM